MINKEKIWFLTLFSIILVLSVYYVLMPEDALSDIIVSEEKTSEVLSIEEEDTLAALRVQDDDTVEEEIKVLKEVLLNEDATLEEKNNAYDKIKSINSNKALEDKLESIILDKFNLKSFIKVKDDQISVVINGKNSSYKDANNIIRTIQENYQDKMYITIKYQ